MSGIRIEVGKYHIGDLLEGEIIREFSKAWNVKIADKGHFKEKVIGKCGCGKSPVYQPSLKCEHCINRIYGADTEFCNAYFS